MTITATIDQLKPGQEYPDGNINARLHYTDAEIDELAASLMPDQDGQLRPFLVATHPKKPGVYFVFGGGRRRTAYERLIGAGKLPKDHPIEIKDHGHIAVREALSKSLADNAAVPMHPADQAVTFAKLATDRTPEEIARDRGMTVKAVSGLIALGENLAPEVLKSWREGKIKREAVQVLILADKKMQAEALEDLERDGNSGNALRALRNDIMGNKEAVMTRLLGFVGIAAARAGGVEVAEDFFGQGGVVKDLKPLEKLANKKMRDLERQETQAGWSWVDAKTGEFRFIHHGLGEQKVTPAFTAEEKKRKAEIEARLKGLGLVDFATEEETAEDTRLSDELEQMEIVAKNRAYTEKQRKGGGVIIRLRVDGSVHYSRGLIRREEKKEKKKQGGGANYSQPRDQEPLSHNARSSLEDWQSNTLGALLAKHPHNAAAAMVAGVFYIGHDAPADLGVERGDEKGGSRDYAALFAKFRKLSDAELIKTIGGLVGSAVQAADYNGKPKASAACLINAVGENAYQDALAKAFEPSVYFGGASKKHMLGVMAEAFGSAARRDAEDKTDDAIKKICIAEIGRTGWLPPELRTKLYKGTTAKAPAKDQPKKKAA